MPLPVPVLDDRTFDDLVAEARRMIPKLSREWTDHNPSDPGITLAELFAWLMEAAIYRMDRVPEKSIERFLQMVGTVRGGEPIAQAIQRALRALTERTRAVTLEDFEELALNVPTDPTGQVARAKAGVTPEGDVRLVIVPPAGAGTVDPPMFVPEAALITAVRNFLEPFRLITTRLAVSGPVYVSVSVDFRVIRDPASVRPAAEIKNEIIDRMWTFFHPLQGGWDSGGWEFGRNVYRTELYQLLERVEGVDHVEDVLLKFKDQDGTWKASTEVGVPPLGLVSAGRTDLTGRVDEPGTVAQ